MKTLLQLSLFFIASIGYSQYTWSPATIYLNDNTVLKGEAVIRQGTNSLRSQPKEKLRFRKNNKDKAQKIEASTIDSIHITVSYTEKVDKRKFEKERQATFIPMYIDKGVKRLHFLEVLRNGEIRLYGQSFNGGGGMNFMPMGSTPTSVGNIPNAPMFQFYGGHNRRFLSKGTDTASAMFRKSDIVKFFNDCPILVAKIKDENLDDDDLNTIIEYYYSHCNKL